MAPAHTLRRDLLPTAVGLLLLLAWDGGQGDLTAVRLFGSAEGFVWRDHWLTRCLLHDGGRWLAWVALGGLVVYALRPARGGLHRRERWRWVAVTLLCAVAVPMLKRFSITSCPWDLWEFGGIASHVSHWRFGVTDGGDGHCFPSGHATSAFAFFGGWFMLRDTRPRAARWWLAAVLAIGLVFGWAQLARGAHYPSHSLWSAWLCWSIWVLAAPRQSLTVTASNPAPRHLAEPAALPQPGGP